jgi:hypothetical protein
MQSFLDVTLPPVLLVITLTVIIIVGVNVTVTSARSGAARQRTYRAQRDGIMGAAAKVALTSARSVLSDVISDALSTDGLRNRAIDAYDLVNQALSQEN